MRREVIRDIARLFATFGIILLSYRTSCAEQMPSENVPGQSCNFVSFDNEIFEISGYNKETTYVEVDKSLQHAVMLSDGEIIWESDCVTGLPKQGTDTHEGVFHITQKDINRTLQGSYGKSYVYYWMRFNDWGEGLHDARTWRGDDESSYGGEIYKTNGSHGCVNLPYDKAKELYELVDIETMVIIHQ